MKVTQYIKANHYLNKAAFISVFALLMLSVATIHPLSTKKEYTKAAPGSAKDSSLALNITSGIAAVDLTVNSLDGTFATSSRDASFSVTTNNFTGYTLSISAKDDNGTLKSASGSDTLSSISSAIPESTFSAANNTSYNGKWGYKPSKLNSAANNNFLPSPTTTATTLDTTSAANTTANNYTIALGARADYSTKNSVYSNMFAVAAVSNPINYTITYNKNTTDTVDNLPSTQSSSTSATSIKLSTATPTRSHYTFIGWCTTTPTTTNGLDSCAGGITFLAGANFGIDQTTLNETTLYAMWKIDSFTQTTQVRYENADGTWGSYSTVDTKTVNYGSSYSWDTSSISGFNTTQYKANSVAAYTVTAAKTNQVSISRATYKLTVTAGTNTSAATGAGTYRWGQTVTVGVTKAANVACTTYATPTWTKTAGTLSSTSGTSVTFTMPTQAATVTATSAATAVKQTITLSRSNATNISIDGTAYTASSVSLACGNHTITGTFPTNYGFGTWASTAGTVSSTSTLSTTVNITKAGTLTLTGYQTMQSYTDALCKTNASSANVNLIDARDNKVYTARYIGDRCYMTKNLDLAGGTTLTSSTSNVTSNYTLPASSTSGFSNNATAYVYNSNSTTCSSSSPCYSYYSFTAATAGTGGSMTTGNATQDICPKGWRLPTKAEFDTLIKTYDTGTKLTAAPFNGVYAGDYWSGSFGGGGGDYWSSTVYGSVIAYYLRFNDSFVDTRDEYKRRGFPVRCVAKPAPVTVTLSKSNAASIVIDGTTYTGTSVSLEPGTHTISGNFTGAYGFSSWASTAGTVASTSTLNTTIEITKSGTLTLTGKVLKMQEYTKSICQKQANGTPVTLTDSRDSTTYSVAYLKDGNCWMLQNLKLGAKASSYTLTTANSDTSGNFTLSGKLTDGKFTDAKSNGVNYTNDSSQFYCTSDYGCYYNWYTATAGSGTSAITSGNVNYSICPKGWTLPTGGDGGQFQALYNAYPSVSAMLTNPTTNKENTANNMPGLLLGGRYVSSGASNVGSLGYYWSRTAYSAQYGYHLVLNTSNVYPANSVNKYGGFSVRCLAK